MIMDIKKVPAPTNAVPTAMREYMDKILAKTNNRIEKRKKQTNVR